LHLARSLRELAKGNFDVRLSGLDRTYEIGAMAHAIADFKLKAEEKGRREAAAQAELVRATVARRRAEMQRLADAFEQAVGNIVRAVADAATELEGSAATLSETAETTKRLSSGVAAASETVSVNVQSVAAATEEKAASASEVGR